jgi:WD40 repeat protein
MGKPKAHPPSRVDYLTFPNPIFGLSWYGSPCGGGGGSGGTSNDDGPVAGCSAIAYCGGGGGGRHGVGNAIVVRLSTDVVVPFDDGAAATTDRSNTTTTRERQIVISTGQSTCVHVHIFRKHRDVTTTTATTTTTTATSSGMDDVICLLSCVEDEVILYGIPLVDEGDSMGGGGEGAIVLGRAHVGDRRGANVSTYSSRYCDGKIIHLVAVGCEDGSVLIYRLGDAGGGRGDGEGGGGGGVGGHDFVNVVERICGHDKAVTTINFHPRGTHVLTSAKDGTSRIFPADDTNEASSSSESTTKLTCEVHDPKGPPPPPVEVTSSTDPRFMKRPPQIIVRGSYYGDLSGDTIYTIACMKRGPTYLSKWKRTTTTKTASSSSSSSSSSSFEQEYRVRCSSVPISSTSMSSDGTILVMGTVDGSVILYDLESSSVIRQYGNVHDMPVTCVASRPIPRELMLPGELGGGVNYDAVSASADNKLGMWTLQKRSRIVPPRRTRGALESYVVRVVRVPLLILLLLSIVAVRDTVDVCGGMFDSSALFAVGGMSAVGRCLFREVLWAEEDRVSFVPE